MFVSPYYSFTDIYKTMASSCKIQKYAHIDRGPANAMPQMD
jgi:hypothetical protein